MDKQKNNRKVSAVVPCFNEEKRIARVLKVLCSSAVLDEIIVVDDGSNDKTEEIVRDFPVIYLKQKINQGKGKAMNRGVLEAKNNFIFFCDADIRGLRSDMIEELVLPVQDGEVDMYIAMRNRKSYVLRFLLAFIPLLGGERVVTKDLWNRVPDYYKTRFRIEAGLNFYAKYYGKGFRFKVFRGLSQTIKEKKYGLWKGLKARVKMMADYLQAQIRLELVQIPNTVKNRRFFLLGIFSNVSLFLLGIGIFFAVYFGPRQFLLSLFARRLATDPSTPIVDFLLQWTSRVSINVLLFVGILICSINAILLLANLTKLLEIFYQYSKKWKISVLAKNQIKHEDIVGEKKEIL